MGLSRDQKRSPRIQTRSRYLGTLSNSDNSRTNNSSNRGARSSSCNSRSRPPNKHFGKANSKGFRQQGTSSSQVFRLAEVSVPPVRLSAASNSRALGSLNRDSVANSPQARRVRRSLLVASLESRPIAVKNR